MAKKVNGNKLFEGRKKELFDDLFKVVLEFIEKNAYNTSPDGDRIKLIGDLREENEELRNRITEMKDLARHGASYADQTKDYFLDINSI